jgi:lauroyl/myristoyl acyltransferase
MVASYLFHGLRAIERACPPPILAALVWPGLATLGIVEACGTQGRQYRRRMATVHGVRPGLWESWRQAVDRLSMRFVCLWPERFLVNPWRSRLSITGLQEVRNRLAAGTPVVFAVLHFGELILLHLVLRVHGIPVASLTASGDRSYRDQTDAVADVAGGLRGVPRRFMRDSSLRQAYCFLRSGGCLLIACDLSSKHSVDISTDLGTVRLATGAFQMAGMAGACVVPVILWQERRWRFGLAFGSPLAPSDGSSAAVKRIAEACVAHWVPVIKRYPEQYTYLDHRIWTPALESGETPTA